MKRMCFRRAGPWLLLLASASALSVQTTERTISAIDVVGARTVGARQVRAWSELEEGDTFSEETVAAAIRNLFKTGKFSDIFVYRQDEDAGVRLIFNLREFPRIKQVAFKGNDKVKDDDLREAFGPKVGQFANPAVLIRELAPLRELYQEKGYYNMSAHLDSSVVDASNLQDLVVTIVEGRKVKARTIAFAGNTVFSDDELRGKMKQSTGGFLKSSTFKKQQFEEDKQRISAHYRDHGYLDAAVTDVDLEFVENHERLDLLIRIDEGPQYTVGRINWEGNTVFDDIAVARLILLEKGDIFRESDYQETVQTLHSLYWDSGYIYITIEPERDIRDNVVDVVFRFQEGEPAHVRDVTIVENLKTFDDVILREMHVFPGDLFSNSLVGLTQRDIFQLGYFEDVQVDFRPADTSGDIDLIMKVKEKQTGQFSFGMAYSAQTSATGFIQIAETNFRGKGQNIGLAWQFGSRQRYVDLNFTEPWFMGRPMLVGADLFDRYQYNFDDFYESRIRGLALRLGRRLPGTRYSRLGLRYELSETRLSNFSYGYINYLDSLEDQVGSDELEFERLDEVDWPRTKSAVTLSFSRNSTDNPFFPTAGSRSSYSVELSGGPFGGEIEYQKHLLKHSYYQKLPGGFALNLRTAMGLIHGLDNPDGVPDYEKFRLGGNRVYPLRGYRDLEIVPRGNPGFIGGRFYTIMSTEILYPLTQAVQLLGFVDQGDTWNSFGEADFTNLRKGAGFGIRVEVPMMGTIGFDYGYGFDRAGGPGWEPHFNFGTFF
ncbi:outer membrane protein assembly factor BamA [bacterium]|nr:outer membrane protein assembly factor BamA [bacterium]